MNKKNAEQRDNVERSEFDNPSFWFVMEDKIKALFLGSLYYGADINSLGLKGNESVLDFGCGGGVTIHVLMKYLNKSGHVLGVDTSAYWINVAKKRLKKFSNVECRTGDIRTMNIPEHSFDVIITIHVLHHVAQEERQGTLMILSRLLKGGRFMVRERIKETHGIPTDEIRTLLSGAGFKEMTAKLSKSEYRGIFVTDTDSH